MLDSQGIALIEVSDWLQVYWDMGRTVPAYHLALEEEISRWSGFVRALRRFDWEEFICLGNQYKSLAQKFRKRKVFS
jgi:hypothetical protein